MFVLESRQVGDVQNLVLIFWNFNIIRKIILEYKNYKTWKLKKNKNQNIDKPLT